MAGTEELHAVAGLYNVLAWLRWIKVKEMKIGDTSTLQVKERTTEQKNILRELGVTPLQAVLR